MLSALIGVVIGIALDRKYPQPVDFLFKTIKAWWNGLRKKAETTPEDKQ